MSNRMLCWFELLRHQASFVAEQILYVPGVGEQDENDDPGKDGADDVEVLFEQVEKKGPEDDRRQGSQKGGGKILADPEFQQVADDRTDNRAGHRQGGHDKQQEPKPAVPFYFVPVFSCLSFQPEDVVADDPELDVVVDGEDRNRIGETDDEDLQVEVVGDGPEMVDTVEDAQADPRRPPAEGVDHKDEPECFDLFRPAVEKIPRSPDQQKAHGHAGAKDRPLRRMKD